MLVFIVVAFATATTSALASYAPAGGINVAIVSGYDNATGCGNAFAAGESAFSLLPDGACGFVFGAPSAAPFAVANCAAGTVSFYASATCSGSAASTQSFSACSSSNSIPLQVSCSNYLETWPMFRLTEYANPSCTTVQRQYWAWATNHGDPYQPSSGCYFPDSPTSTSTRWYRAIVNSAGDLVVGYYTASTGQASLALCKADPTGARMTRFYPVLSQGTCVHNTVSESGAYVHFDAFLFPGIPNHHAGRGTLKPTAMPTHSPTMELGVSFFASSNTCNTTTFCTETFALDNVAEYPSLSSNIRVVSPNGAQLYTNWTTMLDACHSQNCSLDVLDNDRSLKVLLNFSGTQWSCIAPTNWKREYEGEYTTYYYNYYNETGAYYDYGAYYDAKPNANLTGEAIFQACTKILPQTCACVSPVAELHRVSSASTKKKKKSVPTACPIVPEADACQAAAKGYKGCPYAPDHSVVGQISTFRQNLAGAHLGMLAWNDTLAQALYNFVEVHGANWFYNSNDLCKQFRNCTGFQYKTPKADGTGQLYNGLYLMLLEEFSAFNKSGFTFFAHDSSSNYNILDAILSLRLGQGSSCFDHTKCSNSAFTDFTSCEAKGCTDNHWQSYYPRMVYESVTQIACVGLVFPDPGQPHCLPANRKKKSKHANYQPYAFWCYANLLVPPSCGAWSQAKQPWVFANPPCDLPY